MTGLKMTYNGLSRFFGRFPNKLNPLWIAKFAMERLGEQERWSCNWKNAELSRQIIAMRLANKRQAGEPIHVVFLCHMPSAWSTYDALVRCLRKDTAHFRVTLLASPYRHSTFGDDKYHDEGMATMFKSLGLPFLHARDPESEEWLDLRSLAPDFFFYQTPYNEFYPESFRADYVASFAAVCYAPYYGDNLVPDNPTPYPPSFFSNVTFWFAPHQQEPNAFYAFHPEQALFVRSCVRIVGLTRVQSWLHWSAKHTRPASPYKLTMLWTPRWNKGQGLCSFFDLLEPMMRFAEKHPDFKLLLRPHPLMFQAMRQTRDMGEKDFRNMESWFTAHDNAELDVGGDFWPSVQKADLLLSDTSSMIVNFAITGKPVIHTVFQNEKTTPVGEELNRGFYKAKTVVETIRQIEMLLDGKDPLFPIRTDITNRLFNGDDAVENIISELLKF